MKRTERIKRDARRCAGLSIAFSLWGIIAVCVAIVHSEDGGELIRATGISISILLFILALRNASEAMRHARDLAMWEKDSEPNLQETQP